MAQLMVDSSVLIRLERSSREISDLSSAYPDDDFAIAAITASELMVGIHRAESPERRQQRQAFVNQVIEAIEVISFDLGAAVYHANALVQLARAGDIIGANDLLIAATALAHELTILTADLRSFPRVPNLSVRAFN